MLSVQDTITAPALTHEAAADTLPVPEANADSLAADTGYVAPIPYYYSADSLALDSLALDSLRIDSLYRDSLYQDSLLQVRLQHEADSIAALPKGKAGDPLSFSLHRNDAVTGATLLCLLLVLFVVAQTRHRMAARIAEFFMPRGSQDDTEAVPQCHPLLWPATVLLFGLQCGILMLGYIDSTGTYGDLSPRAPQLLGVCVGTAIAMVIVRLSLYAFVNNVFFDRHARHRWRENYNLLFLAETVLLLPVTLVYAYTGIPTQTIYICLAALLGLVKLLLLIKSCAVLFPRIVALPHLLLYFASVEVVPVLVWWMVLNQTQFFGL